MIPCEECLVAVMCKQRFKEEQFQVINVCDIIFNYLVENSEVCPVGWYGSQTVLRSKVKFYIRHRIYKFFYGTIYPSFTVQFAWTTKDRTVSIDKDKKLFIQIKNGRVA